MHEPMSERHYVFSDSPINIYRYYIDPELARIPIGTNVSTPTVNSNLNVTTIRLQIMNIPNTSTRRTEDDLYTIS